MTVEIEVKVLNVNLGEMEEKLQALGAKLVSEEYQVNTIIDRKDGFIEKELDSYLRIRETRDLLNKNTTTTLTMKKNIGSKKSRKNIEISTEISNKEAMLKILSSLEYDVVKEGYKNRKTYIYDNIRFDLDKWDKDTYPYEYMEIEVKREEDLDRAVKLLNIDKEQISTKSIMELRKELK